MIKGNDEYASMEDLTITRPESVLSGRIRMTNDIDFHTHVFDQIADSSPPMNLKGIRLRP
jgi:hypothetical protein